MSVAKPRYCDRGEKCLRYDPNTGKAQKLGPYHKTDLCGPCNQAAGDANFDADSEAVQSALSIEYERAKATDGSLAARLMVAKENFVAPVVGCVLVGLGVRLALSGHQ